MGSIRAIRRGNGTVERRFDYYPFGSESRHWEWVGVLQAEDISPAGSAEIQSGGGFDFELIQSGANKATGRWRFGGKEIAGQKVGASVPQNGTPGAPAGTPAAAAGRPYLDFGARLYDPRTAAWLSQDPLSEKYYPISPCAYCTGNPVNLVDPKGCAVFIVNGKVIGNDGVDDGRLLAIRTEVLSAKEQKKTINFIKNYSGNTRAFLDNGVAYTNSIAIEPSADNRNAMVDEVSKDNGKGGTSDNNNREYGGSIKDGKVVVETPGPIANPKTDSNAHISLPVDRSTFHSHPSGYIIERENTSSNNLSSSSTMGGISETTYSFKPEPSPEDIQHAGTYTCYVFARGNGQVYVYNSQGVQAIIPMKYFVNFKR